MRSFKECGSNENTQTKYKHYVYKYINLYIYIYTCIYENSTCTFVTSLMTIVRDIKFAL